MAVPSSTSRRRMESNSSFEPSHQWMRLGLHISAISSTQRSSLACRGMPAAVSTSMVVVAMTIEFSGKTKSLDLQRQLKRAQPTYCLAPAALIPANASDRDHGQL